MEETKPGTASSSTSNSDLDYYSSEETETLSSDYAVLLRKLHETEDLKNQMSNLEQETDDQNMDLPANVEGKRNEDGERFKGLMKLLLNHNKDLELELENKFNEVSETEKRINTKLKIVEEKEDLLKKLEMEVENLQKQKKELSEEMKCKITEIDLLKEENQKLHTTISDLNSLQKEKEMQNIHETEDQHKLVKEQEDIIHRLSTEIKEQKNNYMKTQDNSVSEIQIKKIKEMVEEGLTRPEIAIKKLEELVSQVTRLAKEIDTGRKWVHEKNKEMKNEVETLEAKLECREAQESLLKEKLAKLETKLGEEGTGKVSLEKAMRRIKRLEIEVKEKEFEILSIGEGKREAIRQLCVLMEYQRCRFNHLKSSFFKLPLQP